MHHLINILGKALLCQGCVRIPYPPSDVRGEICAWGKGQNRAVQSRKNFAQKQQILLDVSK